MAIASALAPFAFNASTSKDLGSASERVAFVEVTTAGADVTETPTINGVAMTPAAASFSPYDSRFMRLFYYISPPSGSQTVDPKNAGAMDNCELIVLSGVDQTTPYEGLVSGSTTGTQLNTNVTVSTSGAWLCAMGHLGSTLTSVAGSLDNGSKASQGIGAYSNATVATGTRTATINQNISDGIGIWAFAVRPSGGGAAAATLIRRMNTGVGS